MNSQLLDTETFEAVVKNTPLVSIDLIIKQDDGSVLLGKRNNSPAKNYWFVPGGRVLKNESLDDAMQRIFQKELGVALKDRCHFDSQLIGVYQHFYDDCFLGNKSISTHYVVIAFSLSMENQSTPFLCDEQHSTLEWWSVSDLLASPYVHEYTKNYFV